MSSRKLEHSKNGSNKLTARQKVFVDEYLADADMNASEAARKAGYSGRNAANKLLANREIQKAIGKGMRLRSERTEVSQDDVLRELAAIAFINLRNYIKEDGSYKDLHEMTDEEAAPIAKVNRAWDAERGIYIVFGYEFWDKQWALEKLIQHLGMVDPRFQQEETINIQNILSVIVNAAESDNVIDGDYITQMAKES